MRDLKVLQIIKEFVVYLYILSCALLMSLLCLNNPFQRGFTGTDSSVFIYVAKVIISGGMPYRDTFDHKGPLIYLIDALGLRLNEEIGIWFIEVITLFIIFLFSYKLARLLQCSSLLSCFVITIGVFVLSYYFQGGNLTEEYACAFIIVSLYFFKKYFINNSFERAEVILCGLSFASVCMLRINMTALWFVMCLGTAIRLIKQHRENDFLRFIFWFFIGIVIVFLPIVLWLLVNNAFYDFISDYFLFNFMYSSSPAGASLLDKLDAISFFLLSPTILLTLPFFCFLCFKQQRYFDCLCAVTLLLSVVLSCISGHKYKHYGMVFYPLVIFMFCRILLTFFSLEESTYELKIKKFFQLFVYLFLICFYFLPFAFTLTKYIASFGFAQNDVFIKQKQIAIIVQSLTDDNDSISVVGNTNIFYLLSNRQSASKYSYQNPIALVYPKIWEKYFDDIGQRTAKVIILEKKLKHVYPFKNIMEIINNDYRFITMLSKWEIYLLDNH